MVFFSFLFFFSIYVTPHKASVLSCTMSTVAQPPHGKKVAMQFCVQCRNLLKPREDTKNRRLMLACTTCNFVANAASNKVYENVIMHAETEKTIILHDVASDPSLQHIAIECENCHYGMAACLKSSGGRAAEALSIMYQCLRCAHRWEG